MRTFAAALLLFVFVGVASARATTLDDIAKQAQAFATAGIKNADTSFAGLRTDAYAQSTGQHFHTNLTVGDALSNCHISGYPAAGGHTEHWNLACLTPYISADQAPQVRAFLYRGMIRAMPACFQATTNPVVLADEDYRWDCHDRGRAYSLDITSIKSNTGSISFLVETYQYISDRNPTAPFTLAPFVMPKQRTVTIQPVPNGSHTLTIGSYQVAYPDYLELALGIVVATDGKASAVVPQAIAVPTAGNEMPAYDWAYHYAGRTGAGDAQVMNILVCTNLSQEGQVRAYELGTLLGLLDAGKGGPVLQKAYQSALSADTALGPQAPDPFLNRHALIDAIGRYFVVDQPQSQQ